MSRTQRMPEHHLRILEALDEAGEDRFIPFKSIAATSGVERRHVRRIVRHLARKGLTKFSAGLWTDDGAPAGAGYGITPAGRAFLDGERRDIGERG